jgi:hypothetical protein
LDDKEDVIILKLTLGGDVSLCLIKQQDLKTCGGMEVYIHAFLTSAKRGDDWSVSHQCPMDRRLGGPQSRSGCDSEEKNPCRGSNPGYSNP